MNSRSTLAGSPMQRVLLRQGTEPYFASIPTPLARFRRQFEAAAASFAALEDDPPGQANTIDDFGAKLSTAVLGAEHAEDSARLAEGVLRALGPERFSVASLSRLNAAVMGKTSSGVRSTTVWMGAEHPRHAWYVAPPPRELPRLLRDLCHFCNDERLPVSLKCAVALQQLVLIHPFADGNGRTARALYCRLMFQSANMAAKGGALIDSLFGFKAMRLQRLQQAIIAQGDWDDYVQHCRAIYASVPRHHPAMA